MLQALLHTLAVAIAIARIKCSPSMVAHLRESPYAYHRLMAAVRLTRAPVCMRSKLLHMIDAAVMS